MSVFLAPSSVGHDSRQSGQFRAFFALGVIRQVFLLLAFLGALGIIFQFFVLGILRETTFSTTLTEFCGRFLSQAFFPIWLGICILGLIVCLASAMIAGRLATKVGKTLLERIRDNPGECSLLSMIQQTAGGTVLLNPTFRLGNEYHLFDLVVISAHGLTFIRTRPGSAANTDVAPMQAACSRLSEQYSLPLLKRVRFIQLWEPKAGPDWQTSQIRDLGRFFQRNDSAVTRQEIAQSLRALYNLALPAAQPAVPVQGSIPTAAQIQMNGDNGLRQTRKGLGILVRLFLCACLIQFLGGLAVFFLQFFNYGMAEKVLVPVRAVLRNTLPADWQERLRLGQEIFINEKHVFAKVSASSARLSLTVGQAGQGNPIRIGTELQIIQVREENGQLWFLVSMPGATGWLPDSMVQARHLVPRGSPLYARPDANAEKHSISRSDQPVALVSVWKRPTPAGEIVWSKVLFLDRNIAYFQGNL